MLSNKIKSLVWRHCNCMLKIYFIVCHNFIKKAAQLWKNWSLFKNICLSWYLNLYLNFQRFKKFKNGKYVKKSCFFVFLLSGSWQFQRESMKKSEIINIWKEKLGHIKRNLKNTYVVFPSLSYLHKYNN